MEPQKKMSLPLTSFASVILGVSASILLNNSLSLYQPFPYCSDSRIWLILFESLLAYLIGFVAFLNIDEYLSKPIRHPRKPIGKKELGLVLAIFMVIFIMLMGVLGSSFKYLNILSFTIFVLALPYFVMITKKKTRRMLFIMIVGGLFLLLAVPVSNLTKGLTHLDRVDITEVIGEGDHVHLEMDTTLLQEDGDAKNICVEMVSLDGIARESAESIRVVDLLKENSTSNLHWSVILHTKNEKCIVYLFIWSSSGKNEFFGIEIRKEDQVWKPLIRELGQLEYLWVYCHSRLKKFYQFILD